MREADKATVREALEEFLTAFDNLHWDGSADALLQMPRYFSHRIFILIVSTARWIWKQHSIISSTKPERE